MESSVINSKKCTRCNKILPFDNFKLKSLNEYNKQCIICGEKAERMPSRSKEAVKSNYEANKELIASRQKVYRDNLPVSNCECVVSFKTNNQIHHLKTKVHMDYINFGLNKEEQQKSRRHDAYEKKMFI